MTDSRLKTGRDGEEMAVLALEKRGYQIIERNFRRREGEIDIIAVKNNCLYFVEVRTRRGGGFGRAVESVNRQKRLQMQRIAEIYLAELGREINCEFLVIAIDLAADQLEIISDLLV
ncbi:MAG: YraN family protein [Bacillota bacterium]|jgi:putative endonuclease